MHITSMLRAPLQTCPSTSTVSVSSTSTSRARHVVTAFPHTTGRPTTTRLWRNQHTTRVSVTTRASQSDKTGGDGESLMSKANALFENVGLSLGPIGMTLGAGEGKASKPKKNDDAEDSLITKAGRLADSAGVSLGPIGMTLGGGDDKGSSETGSTGRDTGATGTTGDEQGNKSIASLTTSEWKKKNLNPDGTVDLFLKDDFNAASRLAGGQEFAQLDGKMTNIENLAWSGLPSDQVAGTRHKVKVTDHVTGEVLEVTVPENRHVLFEAEQDGWELPNACRMGCCTKCAVRVTKGVLSQPEALGLSKKYRDEGYALLCVSTALSDVECVTQDEEEVYQMQFGELFQQLATDKNSRSIVRDDFALEIADMDE